MSAAFDRAAIIKPFTVLGRSLRPYSIGHEILLTAAGNAFAKDSETSPDFGYLAQAVRICRLDYDGAIQEIMTGNLMFRIWMRYLKHAKVLPALEILKFKAYLRHYRSGPDFTRKGELSRAVTGAPFEQTLKVFLCTKMGFQVERALNYPYCAAVADYLTYLESKGAVTLVDDLSELEREHLAMQAQIIEKSKAMGATEWR